jgi:hypothetical protein
VTALTGSVAAYVPSPPGKPYQGRPGLSFTWDGAATPTLTVTETGDGTTCMKFSGQSLAGSASAPQALLSAASPTGSAWEAGPA